MNNIKRDLGILQLISFLYILLFGACIILWSKDLAHYLLNNIQPSKFTIILAIGITIFVMIEMLLKNLKALIEWYKISL